MLTSNPGIWFEIPVSDLPRAQRFYESVFGVQLERVQMGPCDMSVFAHTPQITGAGGALVQGPGYKPGSEGSIVYFGVADIEDASARVNSAGGSIVVPKLAIGDSGFIALAIDTEGNRFGLHSQADHNA